MTVLFSNYRTRANMPKVVYWNGTSSPYVVGRLNTLASRGNIDLEVWFNRERDEDRSWNVEPGNWQFAARYIPSQMLFAKNLHLPVPELREVRPDVLVSLLGDPSFALGSLLAHRYAERVTYRVLPTYDSWIRRSQVKTAMRRFLFRLADGAKVSGIDAKCFAESHGLPLNRLFTVTQSIDTQLFAKGYGIREDEREKFRNDNRLEGCVFIYVGRIWKMKGLDTLISAFDSVQRRGIDATLLLVGDGIDEVYYRRGNEFCRPSRGNYKPRNTFHRPIKAADI